MTKKINIFTCCDDKYLDFIPIFIFSHLYHNPDSFIEVGYDGILTQEIQQALDFISKDYKDKFLVRSEKIGSIDYKGSKIICTPNLTRFIVTPQVKCDNVYISDVDIICLEKNILNIHLNDMSKTGLKYSNVVRKKQTEDQDYFRLTGLHFTPWENFYPLPNYDDLIERKIHNYDEIFLYELVKKRFPKFNYENIFRPVHGIHVSLNRPPVGDIGWGIKKWEKKWLLFRNTTEFKTFEEFLSENIKDKIKIIDNHVNII